MQIYEKWLFVENRTLKEKWFRKEIIDSLEKYLNIKLLKKLDEFQTDGKEFNQLA